MCRPIKANPLLQIGKKHVYPFLPVDEIVGSLLTHKYEPEELKRIQLAVCENQQRGLK